MVAFEQSGILTYVTADLPLPLSYIEGTRSLNTETNYKSTLVDGTWSEGWYHMYVDTNGLSETPSGSQTSGSDRLSTVTANSVVMTQNASTIREIVKTGDLVFTDQTTFTLGSATSMNVMMTLTYGIEKTLCKLTYLQNKPGVFVYDVQLYGNTEFIQITDYQNAGQFGLHIAARGTWSLEFHVIDVII